jgi:hypothetical protein
MAKKLKPQQEREVIPRWRSLTGHLLLIPSEVDHGALVTDRPGEGELMEWARILAYITGTVDQQLLLRNEYLVAENRILKAQLQGRLPLSDAERARLGEIGHRLGRKVLSEVATAALPETIFA